MAQAEANTNISSLSVAGLPNESRLLPSACCPDKDLVLLLSCPAEADVLSLWTIQGAKKWEVKFASGETITALSWAPDGQTFALAHDPLRITHHSIHTGAETLFLQVEPSSDRSSTRIHALEWGQTLPRPKGDNNLPEPFDRKNNIVGSASSILSHLPLLDYMSAENPKHPTGDIFGIRKVKEAQTPVTSDTPEVFQTWPALPSDPLAASIQPVASTGHEPGEDLDVKDRTNLDSLLIALDDSGRIHCFLDGTYPLGTISLGDNCIPRYARKGIHDPQMLVYSSQDTYTNSVPMVVRLPLLEDRRARQVAVSSSNAKELLWYATRATIEMRKAWFGADGQEGARQMNLKWLEGLEKRQRHHSPQDPTPLLDLTSLLTTGRVSDALGDYLSTGELTSERGMLKWEQTVGDALTRLRDYAEKRVMPTCERLHLILEEMKGWSLTPQFYAPFELSVDDIDACLRLTSRAIILAAWLATAARHELTNFREFINFMQYELGRLHPHPDTVPPALKHDFLQVNSYLTQGLTDSRLDGWFTGPEPTFDPEDLVDDYGVEEMASILQRAREIATDLQRVAWPPITRQRDFSHLDRNLETLLQSLSKRCHGLFVNASKAACKSAYPYPGGFAPGTPLSRVDIFPAEPTDNTATPIISCEHTVHLDSSSGQHYSAVRIDENQREFCRETVFLVRSEFECKADGIEHSTSVAIIECGLNRDEFATEDAPKEGHDDEVHVLDMSFFNDHQLVLVFKDYATEGPAYITMVDYGNLSFERVEMAGYVTGPSRESVVAEAIRLRKAGKMRSDRLPIKKQELVVAGESLALAVNGRRGREVACVLGGQGYELETLDMCASADEDEEEEEG